MSTRTDVAPLGPIGFDRDPSGYRHWSLAVDGNIATVTMRVDPDGGVRPDYQLRLNSYDLGVDIELHDVVQRLRFEHPEVHAVVLTGGLDKTFCAGANIQMLAGATHAHKVNFCKFTNETRNSIEDAGRHSGQVWLAAVNGTAAGGGYELALACEDIVLIDDRSSAVSLPEVALLAVLPGTGGLTRVVDKRKVRRDLADLFSTRTEGARGRQALQWGLVDAIAPRSSFDATVAERAAALAARSDRPAGPADAISLRPIDVVDDGRTRRYGHVTVAYDRAERSAAITVSGPGPEHAGDAVERLRAEGDRYWPLAACRQLDDALLHLRFNEPELGTWVLRTEGDPEAVLAVDAALAAAADHWLVREVRLFWARTLRRLDLSARTLITLVEPGSCFAGTLAELAWAADRTLQYDDLDGEHPPATLTVAAANGGWYPMANGLTRLQSRVWGHDELVGEAMASSGEPLDATAAAAAGLVTAAVDDIDWDDEIRLLLAERAGYSPDALTAMEANLRFVGPETMETTLFGRLPAWQNWVFSRPNATGPDGALLRYGSGTRPAYDRTRA
ncbi:MAG: benzoyl-CoA-dihydrodiol lyase [Acidimicrobiales bacterium]|nr:benzoyl-CoA-dihydrodiol lyase [Acidimicrobiales bacterium]